VGSGTTESGFAQGAKDLPRGAFSPLAGMLSTRCTQPAGWQWYPAGYSRVTVHLLHSARWLAVAPRWVLSSSSPLASAALSPLAGSGTPLGTLKFTITTDNGLTILLVVTISLKW
jgi:hypothetical protein